MPKGKRGGKRNSKSQENYVMKNKVRWSSSRKSESRAKYNKILRESGIKVNKNSLQFEDITDELKSSIEKHFGVIIPNNTLKSDEYWTNDIYKHINQGDLSITKANETIKTGEKYLDSKHEKTVVFFKKYKSFGNVKTVIEVSDEGVLLTHTYQVHEKEESSKRYSHFQ
ncbi:MAG: hypothetical protein IKE28_11950 [Solobacterium sp.]|nr:hypothetical protein [Solobacterium sp.]